MSASPTSPTQTQQNILVDINVPIEIYVCLYTFGDERGLVKLCSLCASENVDNCESSLRAKYVMHVRIFVYYQV